MKHTAPEMEALRAQLRELRQNCQELESRLCDLEDEDDPWGVWPYCWVTTGWQTARKRFHSFQFGKLTRRAGRGHADEMDVSEARLLRMM